MASPMFRSPYTTQRYLNPAKICLLALIELYCEDALSDDATLPVLEFITAHVLPGGELLPDGDPDPAGAASDMMDVVSSIGAFERALRPHAAGRGIPGRSVWDLFLQRLWTIDSLHVLHSFLNARTALLEPARGGGAVDMLPRESAIVMRLARGSPFGAFVAKSAFEYTRLRFQDMCTLWKQFVIYRQPSAGYMRRRDGSFNRLSFDSVLLTNEPDWGGDKTTRIAEVVYQEMVTGPKKASIPVTMDDLERLLDFQINQMQSNVAPSLSFPSLSFPSLSFPSLSFHCLFRHCLPRHVFPVVIPWLSTFCCIHGQHPDTVADVRRLEYGIRIPRQIEKKLHEFLDDAVIVPTFRHYLRYVASLLPEPGQSC